MTQLGSTFCVLEVKQMLENLGFYSWLYHWVMLCDLKEYFFFVIYPSHHTPFSVFFI